MILDLYPDIVLTDIRMPGLSGLELIERMHKINKDMQFIILSGYNEFEYAKTAMQYGVRHYLLKPCSEQQIIDSIKEIKQDYQIRMIQKNILTEHDQLKSQLYTGMLISIINHYLAHGSDLTPEMEDTFYRNTAGISAVSNSLMKSAIYIIWIHTTVQKHLKRSVLSGKRPIPVSVFIFYMSKTLWCCFSGLLLLILIRSCLSVYQSCPLQNSLRHRLPDFAVSPV